MYFYIFDALSLLEWGEKKITVQTAKWVCAIYGHATIAESTFLN